nr:MAG TPA: hypothetical protein [Caudoviricetes sp.]
MEKLLSQEELDTRIMNMFLTTSAEDWTKTKTICFNGGTCLTITVSKTTVSVNFSTTRNGVACALKLGNYYSENLVSDTLIDFPFRRKDSITYDHALTVSAFMRELSDDDLVKIIHSRHRGQVLSLEKMREIVNTKIGVAPVETSTPDLFNESQKTIAPEPLRDNPKLSASERSEKDILDDIEIQDMKIELLNMKIKRAELMKQLKNKTHSPA